MAERTDGPNSHAFGTFGTSPAEQALVPKASGSRSSGTFGSRIASRGQGGPFPANYEGFPQQTLCLRPDPHGQGAFRIPPDLLTFCPVPAIRESRSQTTSHCLRLSPLGFLARRSASRAFGSTSASFSTPRASLTALRLAAIHRR